MITDCVICKIKNICTTFLFDNRGDFSAASSLRIHEFQYVVYFDPAFNLVHHLISNLNFKVKFVSHSVYYCTYYCFALNQSPWNVSEKHVPELMLAKWAHCSPVNSAVLLNYLKGFTLTVVILLNRITINFPFKVARCQKIMAAIKHKV